jgi:glycosyltransferase involved in cell wall biosynthesis
MLAKLKAGFNRIGELVLLPVYFWLGAKMALRYLPASKQILFALDDHDLFAGNMGNGRQVFLLVNAFNDAGYSVYIYRKNNLLTFLRLGRYGRILYTLKNVKFLKRVPVKSEEIIYVFDSVQPELLAQRWKQQVYLNILKPVPSQVGEVITIPFSMHPIMYYLGKYRNLQPYRENERKLRVFFGGNTAKELYNNPLMKRQGQLTRLEALEALLAGCPKVKYIENIKKLQDILNSRQYLNEGRVWRADWQNNRSAKLNTTKWLDAISRSDFFLCFSGTDFPMCHNAIEAMAVGTIPIIGYHDWFTPALEHKKNAIVFSGTADLVQKVNEVLNMSPDEIREMRQNVIKYYEEHLSQPGFIRKFEAASGKLNTLMLYPRLVCSEYQNKKAAEFMAELKSKLKI